MNSLAAMTLLQTIKPGSLGSMFWRLAMWVFEAHSVELLLEANHPVRVLDNFSTGSHQNLPRNSLIDIQTGDIRDDYAVHNAVESITHVLHQAAQVSVQASVDNPPGCCSTNI